MIISDCPKCGSKRVRRGYRPTPLWRAFFGRYNLHCVSCNWEFVGFAVPFTVDRYHNPNKSRRKSKSSRSRPLDQAPNENDEAAARN